MPARPGGSGVGGLDRVLGFVVGFFDGLGRHPRLASGCGTQRRPLLGVDAVEGALAGQHGVGRAAEPERVERLHQPPVGTGPTGQVDVGVAVEEHQDRDAVEPICALFVAEVHRHGHASHAPDLEIADHQIGEALPRGGQHVEPAPGDAELGPWT